MEECSNILWNTGEIERAEKEKKGEKESKTEDSARGEKAKEQNRGAKEEKEKEAE